MAKPAWALALLLAVAAMAVFSSSASAQSACAAGTALVTQANAQELTDDCDALLSARDTLAGTGSLNWSPSIAIEEWHGVSVDATSGRVTGLQLRAAGLDGQIPAELGNLDHLQSLHLGENRLNGGIPAELGLLDALQGLYLNANRLTGDIPPELGSLGALQRLYLNGNHLGGAIPSALGGLASLQVLSLSQNRLAGEIPVELGLLGSLRELYLNENQLSGEIPAEVGGLSSLERLYLDGNQFTGVIPTALGALTNLQVLSLSHNQLTGEIPSELGGLTSLQSLFLDGNRLDGMIPAVLGGLANLQQLRLGGNLLTGCVPHTLLGATIDTQLLGLPTCEAPATSGSLTVVIGLEGPRALVRLNTPIGLTATFSQPVSNFTADDISVAFGTVANFGGTGPSYTFDVTPSAGGLVTVEIPAGSATDANGNGNAATGQLLLGIPYDDNGDARISRSEVIAAISDYFALRITRAQAIGVIGLYFTSPDPGRNASAGPDAQALESSPVMLDGTATTGPEGSISSYRWEQVINGSRLVHVAGADTARPTFTLPGLSNDQDFVLRLTVTYNNGETSEDEVIITGRPTPGVIVGAVSGHTAFLNVAELGIRLRSRPSADVMIPVSSSDESEGIPDQSEMVFTPENWPDEQIVSILGQNANVPGGVQNYEIILGDAQSADPLYDGLEIANVAMRGIYLEIGAPEQLYPLIANIPALIQPSVTYTGTERLSFALTSSPTGMVIDFSDGTITWIPQENDEGQNYDVTVRVNDGALFAETSFPVAVVQPVPLNTGIQENLLTVTDQTTTLDGLNITSPADTAPITSQALQELQTLLEKVPPESVPEIPSWIAPISDVFVVSSSFDNPVELRFPVGQLPAGVSLDEVNVYAYIEALDTEGQFWSPVLLEYSYGGTEESPVLTVSLGGLQGLAFFGYHETSPGTSSQSSPSANGQTRSLEIDVSTPRADLIQCDPEDNWFGGGSNHNHHICTYELDPDVRITVKDFGERTRWGGQIAAVNPPNAPPAPPAAQVEDLANWIITAQSALQALGMGYDKDITVQIQPMASRGFVCNFAYDEDHLCLLENHNTLHITDDNSWRTDVIQGTVVHEYFHHAQAHDDTEDSDVRSRLLIKDLFFQKYVLWMIEGTARWFEDVVYDALDTYKFKEASMGPRIMESGLDSINGMSSQRPYARFSFFKFLAQSCDNLDGEFKNLFSARDRTAIVNFNNRLDLAECSFGNHLGSQSSGTLEAAISYYNYATQSENDISLLEEDEDDYLFSPDPPIYRFIPQLPGSFSPYVAGGVHQLIGLQNIPPAGAYSFRVPAINDNLPEGKVAELAVESGAGTVIVSMASDSEHFVAENSIGPNAQMGQDPHAWFSTSEQTSYFYARDGTLVPELFVTLVNPDLEAHVEVAVSVRVRDETIVDPVISSHSTGDSVSHRVVRIVGSIPAEARDETGKVVVTANGIQTETTLNQGGSFAADVVLSLGDNKITAQGFNGSTPVTNEEVITVQGIRSSSTGRNALIPSRVVFVLRWDTDRTDVDIYSTDKNGGTIWYSDKREGPGNLDHDDTYGFGPEVVSYRETNDDVYVNGTFDVDVHYYSGRPSTNYTLDVIVNETEAGTRRSYKYQSATPLTVSNSSQDGPGDSGSSRFNDILSISCNADRVCQVSDYDRSKLSIAGETSAARGPLSLAESSAGTEETREDGPKPSSAYEQCMSELDAGVSKSGSVDWSCNPDGTKQWP